MGMPEYLDFFFRSCFADREDPVSAWRDLSKEGQAILDLLKGKNHFEFKGPNIDLKLSLTGRSFKLASGETNMPDGEIFSGPVEDSVEGWVRFSYPCIRLGTEVEGVELTFEAGKVVHATAEKNEDFLLQQLQIDAGAQYVGELGIGLNKAIQRFTKNMLFDEKLAGTIHLALGAGYPETGSINKSAIHWDMLVDMQQDSQIYADGELIFQDGVFL
jgi:aminopeptidase